MLREAEHPRSRRTPVPQHELNGEADPGKEFLTMLSIAR